MKATVHRFLVVIALLFAGVNQANQTALINAQIYTVNPDQPWAGALLIEDGLITAVASTDSILAMTAAGAEIINLQNRLVLPGFQDAHLHVAEAGFNELLCFLSEDNSFAGYAQEIAECAAQQHELPWVLASGVYVAGLLNRDQLPIDLLDEIIPDKPVLILDNLGHGAWANTLALEAAGYLPFVSQPQGGIVHIDPASERVTGVLFENAQQKLRNAAINAVDPDLSISYQGLLAALPELARHGITTVSDAGGYWTRGDHRLWKKAESNGELTVRASNALYVFPDLDMDEQLAQLNRLYSNDAQALVRFNQVKIYVDGILSLGTGALYEPYDEVPIPELGLTRGFEYFSRDQLNTYVKELDKAGFQLHFHITGDRAAGLALDAVEQAHELNGTTDKRHRITHLYLTDPADWPRFEALGVIGDIQLNPSSLTHGYLDFIEYIVGQRSAHLFAIDSLLKANAKLVLSSDWDAGPLSMLGTIKRALTSAPQTVPDLATAIRMSTLDPAYLLHHDDRTGSLQIGKYADMIVLDQNIFELPVKKIGQAKVLATLLEGEVIYDSQGLLDY